MTITFRDMLDQVRQATAASEGEYDNEGITNVLVADYGLVSIDDIEPDQFWSVVMDHDLDAQPSA